MKRRAPVLAPSLAARPGRGLRPLIGAVMRTLILVCFGQASAQPTVNLGAGVSAGYDSNPAQWHDSPGLAFGNVSFDASRTLPVGVEDLTLALSGWYRDFEGPNDRHRLAMQAAWAHEVARGAGLLTLSATGAAYRDRLVPADERDEATLQIRYEGALSARDMLGLIGEAGRMAYLNPSRSCSEYTGSGHQTDSSENGDCGKQGAANAGRDDSQTGLGLDLTHHWSADLSTMLSFALVRHDSPLPVEAYRRRGAGLVVRFEQVRRWNLELGLGWSSTGYDRAPRHQDREDIQWTAGVAVRRPLGGSELLCSLTWLDSDSTLATRSFRQQVTQCGLSWSF
jgi:hypothetical protein